LEINPVREARDTASSFKVTDDDGQNEMTDYDAVDEFEPLENEQLMGTVSKKVNTSHWRLIEEAKERLRLKRELADYDAYLD
jgi:hypothetical protein